MKKQTKNKDETQGPLAILIVGTGNMGSSLVHGLLNSSDFRSGRILLHDQHQDRVEEFLHDKRVTAVPSLEQCLKSPKVKLNAVVLCTKPQDLPQLSAKLAGRIQEETLVLSILAAVTMADLAEQLKFHGPIVRAMPNIAATVGEAATAMCRNAACDDEQAKIAEKIFASVGRASWTKERLMDAVTGLSGSGPAYIYMVIEALTDGGVKMGLPRPLALELATQTVLGSAKLVQSSGRHPAVLRDQVTTPGGTTITAIHELEERGLRAMLMSAVATATERSEFLRRS